MIIGRQDRIEAEGGRPGASSRSARFALACQNQRFSEDAQGSSVVVSQETAADQAGLLQVSLSTMETTRAHAVGTGGHWQFLFSLGRIPSRNAAGFLGKWISPVIGHSAFEEDHGEIESCLSWQVSQTPRRISTMAVLGLGISPIAFKDQKSRQKKRQHTGFVYCLYGDFVGLVSSATNG